MKITATGFTAKEIMEEVLKYLDAHFFHGNGYILGSGPMTLHGLRPDFRDIDYNLPKKEFYELADRVIRFGNAGKTHPNPDKYFYRGYKPLHNGYFNLKTIGDRPAFSFRVSIPLNVGTYGREGLWVNVPVEVGAYSSVKTESPSDEGTDTLFSPSEIQLHGPTNTYAVTLEGILRFKKMLNRPKDQNDILILEEHLSHKR